MHTILISAFPGTGKTYLCNNIKTDKQIIDSDSSTFDKTNFPENYISNIKSHIGKANIICISTHLEVRQQLENDNMGFLLVYPYIDLKEEYLERLRQRNAEDVILPIIEKNWPLFINQLQKQKNCIHLELQKNEFLSDFIRI